MGKGGRTAVQRAKEKNYLDVHDLLTSEGGGREPQPAPVRMSRLASGAGSSVRLKKRNTDVDVTAGDAAGAAGESAPATPATTAAPSKEWEVVRDVPTPASEKVGRKS